MGQQQLLLLVFSVVVVALAIVGGIEAFSQNKKSALSSQAELELQMAGTKTLAYINKPKESGGLSGKTDKGKIRNYFQSQLTGQGRSVYFKRVSFQHKYRCLYRFMVMPRGESTYKPNGDRNYNARQIMYVSESGHIERVKYPWLDYSVSRKLC